MTVQVIDNDAAFARLRSEWSFLLQASTSNCLFLTWEWLFTWWKHAARGRRLLILAVRRGDELVALAPLVWSPPAVEFLATGTVGSDYLDVIVRQGDERAALEVLRNWLVTRHLVLDFAQLPATGSNAAALGGLLAADGWMVRRRPTDVCPFIRLADHSWESYLSTLGAEHRYNFKRRLRQATRNFDFRFDRAQSPAEAARALQHLIALHLLRWKTRGGSDAFDSAEIVRFHEEMVQIASDRGWLRLFVLSLNGTPAAALYGFRYGPVFYFYQSGYDPAYSKYSVGLLAMGLAIRSALEEGAQEYDLLHGAESYKSHWAHDARTLERLELYAPDRRATVVRHSRTLSRAVRRTARQVLPKTLVDRLAAARRLGVWKGLSGA